MSSKVAINQTQFSFSNVVISHRTRSRIQDTSLLSPDHPDVHVKVKASPNGIRFHKPRPHVSPTYPIVRKPRGEIVGFSKHSQKIFRETLMCLNLAPFFAKTKDAEANDGFFISVDWPIGSYIPKEQIHNDLDKLSKRLRRDFASRLLGAVWKKEVKGNGTPHLHIIVLFSEILNVETMEKWVKTVWTEIVEVSEKYGTDVRPLYGNPSQLVNYLLKPYSAYTEVANIGRIWGKWNAKTLPLIEPDILGLSQEDYPVFLERLQATPQAEHCKMIQKFNANWEGGRVLGDGEMLRGLLEDLPSDENTSNAW